MAEYWTGCDEVFVNDRVTDHVNLAEKTLERGSRREG